MKKIFQYNKDGSVAMYSNGKIKADKFEQIELDITKEQLEKIESHLYNLFIKNKKLVLKEGEVLEWEKEQEIENEENKKLIDKIKGKYPELVSIFEKITNLRRRKI